MDDPEGKFVEEMKELVRKLNELIIDREIALAVAEANHDTGRE